MSKFLTTFNGMYSQQNMEAMCTDIYNDCVADTIFQAMDKAREGKVSEAIDLIDNFVASCRKPEETLSDMLLALLEGASDNPHVHVIFYDEDFTDPVVHVSLTNAKNQLHEIRTEGGDATIYSVPLVKR